MRSFFVLIVAAGDSRRLGNSSYPKQYVQLRQHSVLAHAICNMHAECVYPTRVVIKNDHEEFYKNSLLSLPKRNADALIVPAYGGKRRQDSVRLGLESIEEQKPEFVIIHDACRPFGRIPNIDLVLHLLESHKGVVPALAPVDTMSRVKNGTIEHTLERSSIMAIQTPQIFRYRDVLSCHRKVYSTDPEEYFTDESSILVACGESVATVEGDCNNFKITTAKDMVKASEHVYNTYTYYTQPPILSYS